MLLVLVALWVSMASGAREINLVTFLDCSANASSLEEVGQCDFLAHLGAEVARDVINADPNMRNITFHPVEIQAEIGSEVCIITGCRAIF